MHLDENDATQQQRDRLIIDFQLLDPYGQIFNTTNELLGVLDGLSSDADGNSSDRQ